MKLCDWLVRSAIGQGEELAAHTSAFLSLPSRGFPAGSVVKNLPAYAGDAGDLGFIPGSRRPPGVGNGNPLQFPCLGNLRDRGTWQTIVHRVTKSQMWLSTHTRISAQYITFTLLPKVQFHTHLPFPIFFLLVWNFLLVNICSYSPWVITICGFSLKLLSSPPRQAYLSFFIIPLTFGNTLKAPSSSLN